MTSSIAGPALSVGSRVGRYFGLVSMVPSLFLVLWAAALHASHAWRGQPDFQALKDWLETISVRNIAWIVLATLAVGLFLHPLQFAMTRLLEGYWGSSWPARAALRWRIGHHRRREARLVNRRQVLGRRWQAGLDKILARRGIDPADAADHRDELFRSRMGDRFSGLYAAKESLRAALRTFPAAYPARDRIMPTRLGNALRSGEDTAGRQYGIDAILTAPHLVLVAEESHVRYLRDSRQQFDTAVRLCVVSFLAFLMTVATLTTDGWWLFLALAPCALTSIAYRASVASATDYMVAVATVIDLNRFKLYESLHVALPRNTVEERWNNKKLMALLDQQRDSSVRYEHPAAGTPGTGDATPTPPGTP
ncbi:hypothetical protein [Amycolatopsis vastitatis]|uniref:Uncharacterized protein n=1 Tax=Amycolatopsis vastitatis TaxID=1905142 RepID=A0A229SRI7_9PSEU|nr:hypothetical protein [Amycolatopsis vastitatis]OXM61536.1 hypothetical protein CF165_38285 [Amycolatopsis vastitatis]